jgi:hypothetical protein
MMRFGKRVDKAVRWIINDTVRTNMWSGVDNPVAKNVRDTVWMSTRNDLRNTVWKNLKYDQIR